MTNLFLRPQKNRGLIQALVTSASAANFQSYFSNAEFNCTENFWPFNTEDSSKHILGLAVSSVYLFIFLEKQGLL